MKNKTLRIILLISIISSFSGGVEGSLISMKDNLTVKGKKIAIIAGTGSKDNAALAGILTSELKSNSCLEVLSQKEISKKIHEYPGGISGPYIKYYDIYNDFCEENYTRTDTSKLLEIQKKLGVDYIYAVWVPSVLTRVSGEKNAIDPGNDFFDNAELEEMWVMGLLFESDGKEIGRSNFKIYIKNNGIWNLAGHKREIIQIKCGELAIKLDDKMCAMYRKERASLKGYEEITAGEGKAEGKAIPGAPQEIEYKNIGGIEFAYIKAGAFLMGSYDGWGEKNEHPVHRVILDPFYMSKFEITQKQYTEIMENNPSEFKGDDLPVESVSWTDAVEFCRKFSKKYDVKLRLPTEAEWEYACRSGSKTKYYWGAKFSGQYCWNSSNSDMQLHPAGSRKPNAWGLYDMIGNVWEWCMDWHHDGYYRTLPENNPWGPAYGPERAVRGGSWNDDYKVLRSAHRDSFDPNLKDCITGFRVVFSEK